MPLPVRIQGEPSQRDVNHGGNLTRVARTVHVDMVIGY